VIPIDDQRTLDLARKTLDDITEIEHCTYRIGYISQTLDGLRLPSLVLEFDYPEIAALGMAPALALALVDVATGSPHADDKLRRMIRNHVERYLKALGRPSKALTIDM
jgi:hypothetical protein